MNLQKVCAKSKHCMKFTTLGIYLINYYNDRNYINLLESERIRKGG